MEADYGNALRNFEISSGSRATLAALRPQGVVTFPAGSQSGLEDLVRHAPCAMALLDDAFYHLEVSGPYCLQLGMSRITILGKTFSQLCSVQPEGLEAAFARAMEGESITLENLEPAGDRQGTTWTLHPWRKTRKRIGGVVLFRQEIAKPKPQDNQQGGLIEILEQTPGFMAITNADGKIAFMNANGRRLLGLETLGEARNCTMAQLCSPNNSSQLASLPSDRPWAGEIPLQNAKTRNSIQMLMMAFASSGPGSRAGFVYMGVNLPNHGPDQETLTAFNEEFQLSVRTETLCRAVGGIAHDFNNILLVINGYSSLMMEDLTDPLHAAKAASIFHAGERAAKLADRLLHLSHNCV